MSRSRLVAALSLGAILALTSPGAGRGGPDAVAERPGSDRPASGIVIERAAPDIGAEAQARRFERWRGLYGTRLLGLRAAAQALFDGLQRSSLAALVYRCQDLTRAAAAIDRGGLFASTDVEIDRVLFGALERFGAGARECVAGRYLNAYRLLVEARLGLDWIDARIESRLRPRVPLRGLDPPR